MLAGQRESGEITLGRLLDHGEQDMLLILQPIGCLSR
jgi:hypothetical protein